MGKQNDTIEVRQGEELDKEKVYRFIKDNIEEAPDGDLEIEQFGAGHSNLTYLLRIGNWEAVLRRPPHGPVAPRAHDMEREYNVLSKIHPYFSPAVKPYVFSNDESVVGSPFFIMERRKGIVLDREFPSHIEYTPEHGEKISKLMVEELVKLHSIDINETGLISLGKPEGFMERQAIGWVERYKRAKTDEIENVDEVMQYLVDNIPAESDATFVHYDYKLNNSMFNEDFTKMVGLFDWEMSTVGDPLADLASSMSYWIEANDSEYLKDPLGNEPITALPGFYTREQFINEYARLSGRNVDNIEFYLTFGYFKLAVIGQQIYYRYKKGQTKDERFKKFEITVNNMIQQAYLQFKK